jgi:diguanylate cyclase (GGDEF)-like protein
VSVAMVDLGESPALPADRRRATAVAIVLVLFAGLVAPVVAQPLFSSYPIFAIVIALSISAIAVTAALLWAQARVTRSAPLAVLALGYALTAIVMLPYMLFYRGLWPQLIQWVSADVQTSGWFWVEWHLLFVCTVIAYYLVRRREADQMNEEAFRRLCGRLLWLGAALLAVTMPPLIWIDGLPALSVNGRITPLFEFISVVLSLGALGAIVLAYRTGRFRTVLDLWLAVTALSIFADVTLQHFSHQFTIGWYASRISILLAANAVLWVLLFQTATLYGQLIVTAERLRNESLTDVLTGLANRRAFEQRSIEIMRDCARATRPIALLMIDVDHFKVYNDTYGHQAGDDCLRAVGATLLHNASRARDVVARIGGEEMAVIMPEVDLAGALVVAERMRAAIAAAAIPQGPQAAHPMVTISIGATATRDPSRTSVEDLVSAADRALYHAKESGRNRVVELGEPVAALALPNA